MEPTGTASLGDRIERLFTAGLSAYVDSQAARSFVPNDPVPYQQTRTGAGAPSGQPANTWTVLGAQVPMVALIAGAAIIGAVLLLRR